MAGSVGGAPSAGSGRKKSLDAEVNLVPFIDLLSMCICFLLMTAVWIQIGAMQIKQSYGTDGPDVKQEASLAVEMIHQDQSAAIRLEVKQAGKSIAHETVVLPKAAWVAAGAQNPAGEAVPVDGASYAKLIAETEIKLRELSARLKSKIGSAMVTPEHAAGYGDLVAVIDLLRRMGISNVGVVPVRPNEKTLDKISNTQSRGQT